MTTHLSTSTPASNISSADFAGNDNVSSAELEASLLSDILRNSPAAELIGTQGSQTEEEDGALIPEESSEENEAQETEDDSDKEDGDTKDEESEDDKAGEDDKESTQDTELPTEEDIDWEYKVPVKIDGKEKYLTLEEIRKGYQTDQHLSQKGRELGEQKKLIEQERTTKLQELAELATTLDAELSSKEEDFAAEYHSITEQIKKAREDGDTYTARELRDKQEEVQRSYWEIKNKREATVEAANKKLQEQQVERQKELLQKYNEDIQTAIPDYSDKVAKSIREFALKEGVPESLLNVIYDANVVKFINDYRKLKTAKEAGAIKRSAAPTTKSVPTKKGTPQSVKQKEAANSQRSKVLTGQGDRNDELSFLKSISSISRKLQN